MFTTRGKFERIEMFNSKLPDVYIIKDRLVKGGVSANVCVWGGGILTIFFVSANVCVFIFY